MPVDLQFRAISAHLAGLMHSIARGVPSVPRGFRSSVTDIFQDGALEDKGLLHKNANLAGIIPWNGHAPYFLVRRKENMVSAWGVLSRIQ